VRHMCLAVAAVAGVVLMQLETELEADSETDLETDSELATATRCEPERASVWWSPERSSP
jgi:hypothetical protein